MIALLDADSVVWIISHRFKDSELSLDNSIAVMSATEIYVTELLQKTGATRYLGVFSDKECFRHRVYKFAKYKGNRPPKPEWVTRWETDIKNVLITNWKFIVATDLEADDVVSALQQTLEDTMLLSPDKDLRQNAGRFYDYTKDIFEVVTPEEATKTFYVSMVSGDMTDNVYGIYGLGPVKAAKLFEDCVTDIDHEVVLVETYKKYYGPYYGPIILQETRDCIQMLGPKHRLWKQFLYQEEFPQTTYNLTIEEYLMSIREVPFETDTLSQPTEESDIFKD